MGRPRLTDGKPKGRKLPPGGKKKMKKKYAVATTNIGDVIAEMTRLTLPLLENYAHRINADFVPITKMKKFSADYSVYWGKFQLYDMFADYERIVYIDSDSIVYPHCPNLLEIVPEDQLGVLMESDFGLDPTEEILEYQTRAPEIHWRKDYFNAGVMVASKAHREVFNSKHGNLGGQKYLEQTQLNYNVQRFNIPLFKLDYKFNHTCYWGANFELRDQSYIVHYAAITHEVRTALIRADLERYHSGKPPVQASEFESFFEENFPGKNMTQTMKAYRTLIDSEIESRQHGAVPPV
jgi:lipopolysaccharide biosynthesis glycosyltransferase